jgi:hypothetical protein
MPLRWRIAGILVTFPAYVAICQLGPLPLSKYPDPGFWTGAVSLIAMSFFLADEGPMVSQPSNVLTVAQLRRSEVEKRFMAQVVALAKLKRWAVRHDYDSRRSEPGYPDLTLCRPPRLVFAELKSPKGRPTAEQLYWLEILRLSGVEVHIWRPSDWDEIGRVLA